MASNYGEDELDNHGQTQQRYSQTKATLQSSKKEIVLMDYQQYREMQNDDDQVDTDYDINGFSRMF